jgi:hypothetical protein
MFRPPLRDNQQPSIIVQTETEKSPASSAVDRGCFPMTASAEIILAE